MSKEVTMTPKTALESSEAFREALTDETAKRKLLKEFISNSLTENVDFGKIKIGGRETKPTLFKSGAEKFTSLLKLNARFETDEATRTQLPEKIKEIGVFCYDCFLHDSKGNFVSQGKGACSIMEKNGQINTSIKIAKKRALLDAVIGLGLSDVFTQDLDDMEPTTNPFSVPTGIKNEHFDTLCNGIIDMSAILAEQGYKFTEEQTKFIDDATEGKKNQTEMKALYDKLQALIKSR